MVQAQEKPIIVIPSTKPENISNSWGPVSPDFTTIVTQILVNKKNLTLTSLSIFCEIYLNGIKVATTKGNNLNVERKGKDSLITFTSKIDNNSKNITKWWISHIRNSERTRAVIKGKLMVNSEKVCIVYPFFWENKFQTNMLEGGNLKNVSDINFGIYKLQVKSLHSEWGDITPEKIEIKHTIDIHNPSIVPATPIINRVEYELMLNRIKMAQGGTNLPLIILPGQTKSIVFTTRLDNKKIKLWWLSHIKHNERTICQFSYSLFIKIFGVTVAKWSKDTKSSFETDFLGIKSPP